MSKESGDAVAGSDLEDFYMCKHTSSTCTVLSASAFHLEHQLASQSQRGNTLALSPLTLSTLILNLKLCIDSHRWSLSRVPSAP